MRRPKAFATILLYHGVTRCSSVGIENFSGKHLPEKVFDHQMQLLRSHMTVLPLRKLAARLQRDEELSPDTVAITFDDSFKNVHDVALPILQRHGIPATFFISTGFVGNRKRFWVDRVEHMINCTTRQEIEIELLEVKHTFRTYTAQDKIAAITKIKGAMKTMRPHLRDKSLESLRDSTAVTDNGDTVLNYENLSWEDVRRLDAPPLYEVGGHSVNHEILTYLDKTELRFEIRQCQKDLEQRLGHSIDLFSYPEGHFDNRVIGELKAAGIRICPTATNGVNYPGTDPFHLKRVNVGFMGEPFPFGGAE
jgi:peptidoglycan/xylan/chitin deacetylase (PgdA/CDA1 family)